MIAHRGDQLVRPVNAPPAGAAVPGVQPGVLQSVVFAHWVIIFGTSGGWFIYSGTPAAGNPPIAWGTTGTKDPFGNALPYDSVLGIASTATFSAGDTLITPSGMFVYSGTPGSGNLAFSIAPTSGSDSFGNSYYGGFWAYGSASQRAGLAAYASGPPALQLWGQNLAKASEPAQVYATSGHGGAANEYQVAILFSGQETTSTGNSAVQCFSESDDGTIPPIVVTEISGTQVFKVALGAAEIAGTQPALDLAATGLTSSSEPASVYAVAENAGAANEYQIAVLFSGEETTHTGNAAVQCFSETDDATGAAQIVLEISAAAVITVTGTGVTVAQPVTATAGTASSPTLISTDTWHTPGSLPTGFTGTLKYRLLPDGTVIVICQCSVATTAGTGTITLFSGLDAAHTASVNTRGGCGFFVNGSPTVAQLAATASMRWAATTGGAIEILGFPGGNSGSGVTEVDFVAIYPAGI